MEDNKIFVECDDVMKIFNCSSRKAYEIIQEVNNILNKQGIKTFKGKTLKKELFTIYGLDGGEKN